jgi:aerobic-type carbon monoxide dehydrogenase small subunit (CoxS/CutS family)
VSHRRQISVVVNGNRYEAEVEARKYLAEFLREDLRLVGTHIGCEHGVCGACTVLMDGVSVRSCIVLAAQADEAEIMTVEDLASNGQMHPLQEAFLEKQGLQCGYCTPGMLMRAHELLREDPEPTAEQVREGMSNNLCRCTGYQYIVEAVLLGAERMRNA